MNARAWSGPLGDALALVIDHRGKTPRKMGGEWSESGVPVLSAMHVKGGRLDGSEARCVPVEMYDRWMPERLRAGDVLLTSEAPLGEAAYLREGIQACLGQRLFALRADEEILHSSFLYCLLRDPTMQAMLAAHATGTTVLGIRQAALVKINLHLPDIKLQRSIASVLATYDDLIENNRRRVEILEEMARLIYREWFVYFRFPGHEDSELVDSDLGPIPDGWSVRTLGEVAEVNARTLRKADLPDEIVYIDISSVEPRRIGERSRLTADEAPGRARRVVVNGDVIWSTVRPNRRAHALMLNPEQGTIASTGLAVLSAMSVPSSFLFEWSSTNEFTGYLVSRATGSAYPAVRPSDFEEASIVVPTDELLAKFGERVGPMHQLQATLSRQNEVLREARDLLLPRLVSGELDVSELDLELAETG